MKLDINKKYIFGGDVYGWDPDGQRWLSRYLTLVWSQGGFQHFADRGLVTEFREPRKGSCVVVLDRVGFLPQSVGEMIRGGTNGIGYTNAKFKVSWEEVIE